jgi:hypothetical protein
MKELCQAMWVREGCGSSHTQKLIRYEPGMVAGAYNPSPQEVEAEGARVPGQPGLHSESVSKNFPKQQKPKIVQDSCIILIFTLFPSLRT